MKRKVVSFLVAIVLFTPSLTLAAGLVPCGGEGEPVCQACHAVDMLSGLLDWLIGILTVVFAIIMVSAGISLVTSSGSASAKEKAKSMITNAFVGFVIVLAAWLLIDYGMRFLVSDEGASVPFGTWNSVQCEDQLSVDWDPTGINTGNFAPVNHPTPGQSRGVAYGAASGELSGPDIAALAALGAPDDVLAAAAAGVGLNAEQIRNMQALMRVESGGCRNKQSPVGALGCMQIMPGTARAYDPALQGLSDAQVRDRLLNNDAYNMQLGAQIYADLYSRYDGDERLVFAAYNGGTGANNPSSDCPGQRRWECVWDSPGCYGTSRTDCTPNTGYVETRNYVQKIPSVASQLR